jgi:hypothetical protein
MSDFEPSGCSTDDLSRLSPLNRQLIKCRLDLLRRLGHARDIELLFISEDYRKPDWDLVECFGEEAQQLWGTRIKGETHLSLRHGFRAAILLRDLALPSRASPCRAMPCPASPGRAAPCRAVPRRAKELNYSKGAGG